MWINTYDPSGSSAVTGRINLDHVEAIQVVQAGSNFYLQATTVDTTTYRLTPENLASMSAALEAIEDLLVNGS